MPAAYRLTLHTDSITIGCTGVDSLTGVDEPFSLLIFVSIPYFCGWSVYPVIRVVIQSDTLLKGLQMLQHLRIICLSVLTINLLASPMAFAESTRGIKFEANGLELFGWVPYDTGKTVSIPPIKLPNGELPMDFPATIVNFPRNDKTHDFTLTIAADPKIDHKKLQLVARDEKDLIVADIEYAVISTSGGTNQIITFVCTAKCDPKRIKQLIIARVVAASPPQKQL